jgi:hypothetical protein
MNSTGGGSGRFTTTKLMSTTGSGLSTAAEDVLNETYALHVKPREQGVKDVRHVLCERHVWTLEAVCEPCVCVVGVFPVGCQG